MAVLMAGVELVAGIELVELEVVLLLLDIQMVVFPILRVFGKKKEPTSVCYEYNQEPGLSAHIDRNSSPVQLFWSFFLQMRSGTC